MTEPAPAPIPRLRITRLRWNPFARDRWRWTVSNGIDPRTRQGFRSYSGVTRTEQQAWLAANTALWNLR